MKVCGYVAVSGKPIKLASLCRGLCIIILALSSDAGTGCVLGNLVFVRSVTLGEILYTLAEINV